MQTFDLDFADSGPIRVALVAAGDALAADDAVYAYLPRRAHARLTLVTDSNPYLEKSLAAQPDVQLSIVRPARFREQAKADVYVFDRYVPSRPPAAPALLIRAGAEEWLTFAGREAIAPQVASWDAGHPLFRSLSLRDLQVQRAQAARVEGAEARALLRGRRDEALIVVNERHPRRVWLAFSLEDSNFALQADFPMFLNNAIAWLTTQSAVLTRRLGRVDLPLENTKVFGMDGALVPVRQAAGLQFDAPEPGIYTAVSSRGNTIVAVNLLSPQVTRVNDSTLDPAAAAPLQPAAVAVEHWPVLLFAALVLLVLEWVSYHRRLTV
jgi:hypothetical protein